MSFMNMRNKIGDSGSPCLTPTQDIYGFVKGRSTRTNRACYDFISEIVDSRSHVDSVYKDVSKAFDTVSHRLLIHKMSYGFNGSMLQWLDYYLSNRNQRVVSNVISSAWCKVTSGVPRGSLKLYSPLLGEKSVKYATVLCYI
jgi:hypothetical protein